MEISVTQRRFDLMNFDNMIKAGYTPVAYSVMMMEDTFYFETVEEAKKAAEYFENGEFATREYVGWWYGIEELEGNIEYYHKEFDPDFTPEIIYINKKL